MRYYLYLDTEMLQILVSSSEIFNFNIEIMDFSVKYGETITNDLSVSPTIDEKRVCRNESNYKDNKNVKENKKEDYNKVNIFNGKKVASNKTVERRYINIKDVERIKNIRFYNSLIDKLEKEDIKGDKIFIKKGKINICKLRSINDMNEENMFFCIDENYVWLNKSFLKNDLIVISALNLEVTVIGYFINNNQNIIRAICIYV